MQNRSLVFYLVMAFILIALGFLLFFGSDYLAKKAQEKKSAPKTLEQIIAQDLTAPKYEQIGQISEETLKSLSAPKK